MQSCKERLHCLDGSILFLFTKSGIQAAAGELMGVRYVWNGISVGVRNWVPHCVPICLFNIWNDSRVAEQKPLLQRVDAAVRL